MKQNKNVVSSCFNEKETAESILLFDNVRLQVFNRHIEHESTEEYYLLISKYLLSLNKYSIEYIKTIIKRHIAVSAYFFIRKKNKNDKKWEYRIRNLDEIIDKKISLNDLAKAPKKDESLNENPFWILYSSNDHKEIKGSISKIIKLYEKLDGLLNNVLDYFYYGCRFLKLEFYNHSDLAIAHCLNDDMFDTFTFVPLDDNYSENWIYTNNFKEIDIKEKTLGHVINIIMKNKNFDLKNDMKTSSRYYYEMMFNIERKDLLSIYRFFKIDYKMQTAYIDKSEIRKSFKFKYNGIDYIFTPEGISRI